MEKTNDHIILEIDGYKITVTHPDKILFPRIGITKIQVIRYYLSVASYVMTHNQGRPLVFIRYPHGAPGYSFFQKNVPPHAPEFIETVELGKHKIARYIILNHLADLAWLVQLHALEFHIMGTAKPHFNYLDVMVFDIDPPEGMNFPEITDFASEAKPIVESFGYRVFVKTSGKRGVHMVCPLLPQHPPEEVLKASEEIARAIMNKIPGTTLDVRKNKRKNKILIDIYRNRPLQTFSMPYGLRATDVASVSLPVSWEELKQIKNPLDYHIGNVPELLSKRGDPWQHFREFAVNLHTKKSSPL